MKAEVKYELIRTFSDRFENTTGRHTGCSPESPKGRHSTCYDRVLKELEPLQYSKALPVLRVGGTVAFRSGCSLRGNSGSHSTRVGC